VNPCLSDFGDTACRIKIIKSGKISLVISSFSLCLGLGASLGIAWIAWRSPKDRSGLWLNAGLWALFGALAGARIAFILTHPTYYATHGQDIPQVWLGGLSWPGGLAGFWLAMGAAALVSRASLAEMADGLLPLLPPLLVGTWLGGWLSGVAYGALAPNVWWAIPAPDEWGQWSGHVPLQIAGALASVTIFMLVDVIRPRLKQAGQAASLAYLGVTLLTLGLVSLRSDPVPLWNGWRWDILASGLFSGAMILVNLAVFWPRRPAGNQPD
jgi:prolipoprotein diacylglyceryltransferase